MAKNLHLNPEDEIISVVDKLAHSKNREVNLIVPPESQIWQSAINLKLLKREADSLDKEVTFFVSDNIQAEMAQKIGFLVQSEDELPVEEELSDTDVPQDPLTEENDLQEEIAEGLDDLTNLPDDDSFKKPEATTVSVATDENQDMLDYLVNELQPSNKPKDIASALKQPRKPLAFLTAIRRKTSNTKMGDIINLGKEKKPRINEYKGEKKSPKKKVTAKKIIPVILKKESIFSKKFKEASLSRKWSRILFVLIGLSVISAIIVAYLVLPTTEINIIPKTEKMTLDLEVIGSKDVAVVNKENNEIPVEEIEVTKNKSKEFEATGEKQFNDKAEGVITIYNEYDSSPQTLVATTRFESSGGKVFRILENVTVPGTKVIETKIVPGTIDVKVVADQPGSEYNIDPTDFTIPGFEGSPKFTGFYAKSNSSMTGGSVEKVKVISEDDLKKAQETLTAELESEIQQAFEEQIPEELKVIEESIKKEITMVSELEVDTKTDKFTMNMKAVTTALLFKEEDLKELVELNLTDNISANKILIPDTQQIKWVDWKVDSEANRVEFSLYAEEEVLSYIDIDELKYDLAGKSEMEVRKYLAERDEIEEVEVSFWPFWVKRISNQEKRIKVTIKSPLKD